MRPRLVFWLLIGLCLALSPRRIVAQDPRELPSFAEVQAIVEQQFAEQRHLRPGDIICQNEVRSLFSNLETAGWKVEDRDKILDKMLPAGDPLIEILRSPNGAKFMGQVANEKLIYDRLDRIAREPGGQRLLTDLVKLPDAARYAKQTRQPAVPGLEDFLPKDRSGKARHIKDYDKATEKIYTIADLKKALEKSYKAAQRNVGS